MTLSWPSWPDNGTCREIDNVNQATCNNAVDINDKMKNVLPGSSLVPDDALKRACYVTRFLLADHSVVRHWFYKHSGRVGIMARDEVTTDIPEHSYLSPDPWDSRARGLGGTIGNPISTGAEENVLCVAPDRYATEDILLHELAHGVHLIGAMYAIEGWHERLQDAYDNAKATGLWNRTYAQRTFKEYFVSTTVRYNKRLHSVNLSVPF